MNKAILLARENAQLTAEEIVYYGSNIRGGSTLGSVLSAGLVCIRRVKRNQYLTEKRKAELQIVSTFGLTSAAFSFNSNLTSRYRSKQ